MLKHRDRPEKGAGQFGPEKVSVPNAAARGREFSFNVGARKLRCWETWQVSAPHRLAQIPVPSQHRKASVGGKERLQAATGSPLGGAQAAAWAHCTAPALCLTIFKLNCWKADTGGGGLREQAQGPVGKERWWQCPCSEVLRCKKPVGRPQSSTTLLET